MIGGFSLIPLWIGGGFGVLQPPQLAETSTAYYPSQSAYETRSAIEDIEATSIFEVLPSEEPGASNGARFITVSNNNVGEATATPFTLLTGSSAFDLQTYTCNFESDATGEVLPANTNFTVLGWNIGVNDEVYFLIEDDPAILQLWVLADVSVVLSGDYKTTYPFAISCRTWVITPQPDANTTPGASASEESGTPIPLPQIVTATPLPPEPVKLEYNNQQASILIAEDVPDLKNPSVLFTPEGVTVLAQVVGTGPLGITVVGNLMITGTLEIVDAKLVMNVSAVKLNDGDITDTDDGRRAETGVNNWLHSMMIRREVLSYTLGDGLLTIDALEYSESRFPPSPTPSLTPQILTTDGLTVTPSIIPPQVRSITFTPVAARASDFTSAEASASASSAIPAIQDIGIAFTSTGLTLTGEVRLPNTPVSQDVTLDAGLVMVDGQLELDVRSFKAGSLDLMMLDIGPLLVSDINEWWPLLTDGLRVETFELTNGVLKINP